MIRIYIYTQTHIYVYALKSIDRRDNNEERERGGTELGRGGAESREEGGTRGVTISITGKTLKWQNKGLIYWAFTVRARDSMNECLPADREREREREILRSSNKLSAGAVTIKAMPSVGHFVERVSISYFGSWLSKNL